MNYYAILVGGQWLLAEYDGDLFHRLRFPTADTGWLDVVPRHPDPNLDTKPQMMLRTDAIGGVRATDFQLERDQYLEQMARAVDARVSAEGVQEAARRIAEAINPDESDA